jgi:hypothetical protein
LIAAQLYNDLIRAAALKDEKLKVFISHCQSYSDKVPEWNKESREARTVRRKEVCCVYRHTPSKGEYLHSPNDNTFTKVPFSSFAKAHLSGIG